MAKVGYHRDQGPSHPVKSSRSPCFAAQGAQHYSGRQELRLPTLRLQMTYRNRAQGEAAELSACHDDGQDNQEREQGCQKQRHQHSGTSSRLSPPRGPQPPSTLVPIPFQPPSLEQMRWLEAQGRRHHQNSIAKDEEQRQRDAEAQQKDGRSSKIPALGAFLNGSGAKLASGVILDARNGEKVAHFSKKRLTKSKHCDLSGTGPCATTDVVAALQRPLGAMQVAHTTHDEIELGELVGAGSFSLVYEIKSLCALSLEPAKTHRLLFPQCDHDELLVSRRHDMQSKCEGKSRCPYVLKVLQPKLLEDPAMMASCAADLAKEGLLMSTLNHEHILRVRAWTPTGLRGYATGRHDAFFLVLDRLDRNTLADQITLWQRQMIKATRRPLKILQPKHQSLPGIADLMRAQLEVVLQLASAVQYLHEQRIIHRDIKPENVGLVSAEPTTTGSQQQSPSATTGSVNVKLFDFDVARRLPPASSSLTIDGVDGMFMLTHHVGSPRFMSPECARGDAYNASTDVYSFSLVAYQVLSLQQPYADIETNEFKRRVVYEGLRPSIPQTWPSVWHTLLPSCWSNRPEHRPSMDQVYELLKDNIPELQHQLLEGENRESNKDHLSSSSSSVSSAPSQTSFGSLKRSPKKAEPTDIRSYTDISPKSANSRQRLIFDGFSSSSTQSVSAGDGSSLNSDEVDGPNRRRRRRRKPWSSVLKR